MDSENPGFKPRRVTPPPVSYTDPLVIGAGAFFIGFVVGSGRLDWFSRKAGRLAGSLGNLALSYLSASIQQHNPDIFKTGSRMTH